MFDILSKSVDASGMDEGRWLHFTHPTTGEPIYADPGTNRKPARAKVRSVRSKMYRDTNETLVNSYLGKRERAKKSQQNAIMAEASKAERPKKLAVLVVGLENCSSTGPAWVTLTEAMAKEMCDDTASQWMVDQVFDFAQEDSNYGVESEDAGNADAGQPAKPSAEPTS